MGRQEREGRLSNWQRRGCCWLRQSSRSHCSQGAREHRLVLYRVSGTVQHRSHVISPALRVRLQTNGVVSGDQACRLGETKWEEGKDSWVFGWHLYLVTRFLLGLSL